MAAGEQRQKRRGGDGRNSERLFAMPVVPCRDARFCAFEAAFKLPCNIAGKLQKHLRSTCADGLGRLGIDTEALHVRRCKAYLFGSVLLTVVRLELSLRELAGRSPTKFAQE